MKKTARLLLLLFVFLSSSLLTQAATPKEIPNWKKHFDDNHVTGSILIYSLKQNSYVGYNLERCNVPISPASTFKIPNSLIALESRITTLDEIFKWDGTPKPLEAWQQDLNLKDAFRVSAVPVYQEIARRVGVERMQKYVDLLDFGSVTVTASNLDTFWLTDDCKITQFQQVYFLKRLFNKKLPISLSVQKQVMDIMINEENEQGVLYAKTGLNTGKNGNTGWFVGVYKYAGDTLIFATNIGPFSEDDNNRVIPIRINLTKLVLSELIENPSLF